MEYCANIHRCPIFPMPKEWRSKQAVELKDRLFFLDEGGPVQMYWRPYTQSIIDCRFEITLDKDRNVDRLREFRQKLLQELADLESIESMYEDKLTIKWSPYRFPTPLDGEDANDYFIKILRQIKGHQIKIAKLTYNY
jgi:hypothetical protein